jgi:predicted cupin superfamily sugar epimerase
MEDGRPITSAIYYLLGAGGRSHWHRIDAVEMWHHYAGAPLDLCLSADGLTSEVIELGSDLSAGQRPQAVVPIGVWQSAVNHADHVTLVGCTVSPAFEFAGFELAPPDWEPGAGLPVVS